MKNLVLWQEATTAAVGSFLQPSSITCDGLDKEIAFCVDYEQNQLFALASCGRIGRLELCQQVPKADAIGTMQLVCDLSQHFGASERWQWIEFVAELESLVCVSSQGLMATVQPQSLAVEEIGRFENGILALAFSSSQEQVAIATGGAHADCSSNGSILVMNTQWEVLQEKYFTEILSSTAPLANWQMDYEHQKMTLKWRDDGKFLVMNATFGKVSGGSDVRQQKLVVFSESLEFHAVGRLEDGRELPRLGNSLDWAPNHSLLATSEMRVQGQMAPKQFVVFFERNGLRHGEFQVPCDATRHCEVLQLQWNAQSDVLAVLLRQTDLSDGEKGKKTTKVLQLWTRGNYHWYLKQEELFKDDADHPHLMLSWDQEHALRLHLVDSTGQYFRRDFTWDAVVSADDSASVAVIDGSRLLVTPFAKAMVPPPFALTEIPFERSINALLFVSSSRLLVLLSSGQLMMVESLADPQARKLMAIAMDEPALLRGLLEVADVSDDEHTIQIVASTPKESVLVTIQDGCATVSSLPMANKIARATRIRGCAPPDCSLLIQSYDGGIFELCCSEDFPELNDFEVVTRTVFGKIRAVEVNYRTVLVSLSGTKLFVNGHVICNVCSSFVVAASVGFLLFTTVGNHPELRVVPLCLLSENPESDDRFESRRIERGATLVAVVPNTANVVLQLPRGNLECVVPRVLMLSLIVHQINQRAYASALELCRKHRVDLNLIVDYDQTAFLNNVERFVHEIPGSFRSDRLCLFITSLHDVNVWETKFKSDCFPSAPTTDVSLTNSSDADAKSKVNTVCRTLLKVLQKSEDQALLFPLLTSAVKQDPPDFPTALDQVERLMDKESERNSSHSLARKAIKHLIFLVNGEELFEQCVGTYNLPLMRLVLSFLERDPFEELARIKKWQAIGDVNYRKYQIDLHLGLFDKALEHLSRARLDGCVDASTDKCMDLILRGKLFNRGLQLFPNKALTESPDLHQRILKSKAGYLMEQAQYQASGYVFLSTSPPSFREAMESFRLAHDWQMALVCASQLNSRVAKQKQKQADSPEDAHDQDQAVDLRALGYQLAEEMASAVGQEKDFQAIATIYAQYCDDVEEGVSTLVNAKQWTESIRLSHLYQRSDLIETEVKPSVLTCWEELCEDLAVKRKNYLKNCSRLTTIREQKRLFRLHGVDGTHRGGPGEDEDGSQSVFSHGSAASSAFSQSSVSSVGSHNSSVSIGNFPMKELLKATSSHYFASSQIAMDRMTHASLSASSSSSSSSGLERKMHRAAAKRERKQRLQQGSLEEENFVANQLLSCIPSVDLTKEVTLLSEQLVLFQQIPKAAKLQKEFELLLQVIRNSRVPPPIDAQAMEVDVEKQLRPSERIPWRLDALAHLAA